MVNSDDVDFGSFWIVLVRFWFCWGLGSFPKASWRWYASFSPNMSPWRAIRPQIVLIFMIFWWFFLDRPSIFQHFLKKSIPYASSGQTALWKILLYWSSSYELFINNSGFSRFYLRNSRFVCCTLPLSFKNHFFILSLLEQVFKGFVFLSPNSVCPNFFYFTKIPDFPNSHHPKLFF